MTGQSPLVCPVIINVNWSNVHFEMDSICEFYWISTIFKCWRRWRTSIYSTFNKSILSAGLKLISLTKCRSNTSFWNLNCPWYWNVVFRAVELWHLPLEYPPNTYRWRFLHNTDHVIDYMTSHSDLQKWNLHTTRTYHPPFPNIHLYICDCKLPWTSL